MLHSVVFSDMCDESYQVFLVYFRDRPCFCTVQKSQYDWFRYSNLWQSHQVQCSPQGVVCWKLSFLPMRVLTSLSQLLVFVAEPVHTCSFTFIGL